MFAIAGEMALSGFSDLAEQGAYKQIASRIRLFAFIFMLPFFRAPEYFSKFRYLGVDGSGATSPGALTLRATTKAASVAQENV